MKTYIHCDECDKECPVLEEAIKQGWYLSNKLSVSGIPWDVVCPDCAKKSRNIKTY